MDVQDVLVCIEDVAEDSIFDAAFLEAATRELMCRNLGTERRTTLRPKVLRSVRLSRLLQPRRRC